MPSALRTLLVSVTLCKGALLMCAAPAKAQAALSPAAMREQRLRQSPNYKDGKFVNELPVVNDTFGALRKYLERSNGQEPLAPPPVVPRRAADFATPPPSGLRVTWFGHSSLLVEIDGRRFLTDPVWGSRVSPFSFAGPKRFFEPPLPLADVAALKLDAVILSHDHFDHLDQFTIAALSALPTTFVVPLGVGRRLAAFGVPDERIVERDWWETYDVAGITLACTPARHFSGRSLFDRDETLWASWAIIGPAHRVYFSGDGGMFPGFAAIGAKYGPFDITLVEAGAYDATWADVHLGPEQAVRAHQDLRGRIMMPVHWGTFNLALHPWTEPAERVIAAAVAAGVQVVIPKPGESVEPATPPPLVRWWPTQPWQSAVEAPIVSSGLK